MPLWGEGSCEMQIQPVRAPATEHGCMKSATILRWGGSSFKTRLVREPRVGMHASALARQIKP